MYFSNKIKFWYSKYYVQDRQCTYNVTLRRVRSTTVAAGKQCVTYSECVSVALGIQHMMRMRCIILLSVASLALQYFSALSHKLHDFQQNAIEHKMCVLIFSTTFARNISHSKKNWEKNDKICLLIFT